MGLLTEGMEAANQYVNPLVPAAELTVGKSYESGFSADKSRWISGAETALAFNPFGKTASKAHRAMVSLDNNALIHAIENGGKDAIKKAIGDDKPIVSITAIKEFLVKGDINALRKFMTEVGATVQKNGASILQIKSLQEEAKILGRNIKPKDASVVAGAVNNNATVVTRDNKMIRLLQAMGLPVKTF